VGTPKMTRGVPEGARRSHESHGLGFRCRKQLSSGVGDLALPEVERKIGLPWLVRTVQFGLVFSEVIPVWYRIPFRACTGLRSDPWGTGFARAVHSWILRVWSRGGHLDRSNRSAPGGQSPPSVTASLSPQRRPKPLPRSSPTSHTWRVAFVIPGAFSIAAAVVRLAAFPFLGSGVRVLPRRRLC
jgi:hypothetical protein